MLVIKYNIEYVKLAFFDGAVWKGARVRAAQLI
jgi:hypothetical protein